MKDCICKATGCTAGYLMRDRHHMQNQKKYLRYYNTTKRHTGMSDLELVLLAVDDDRSDLLVHKDEDGAEQGGKCGHQQCPPGVFS